MPPDTTPPLPGLPPAPSSIEEAGLNSELVTQLLVKILHFGGALSGSEIARRAGLRYAAIDPLLQDLQRQHVCEIVGGSILGEASFIYRLSDAGHERAGIYLSQNQYAGIAPVPLAQYREYVRAFDRAVNNNVTTDAARAALAHLVLSERILEYLGPAMADAHSLFLYGPPGNGKTSISRALGATLHGAIAVPHAIDVQGNIIRVFDPESHTTLPMAPVAPAVDDTSTYDHRWVLCRRPVVVVGAELRMDSLRLTYNPHSGVYAAPLQMLATGGVLILDDFGRQEAPTRDVLNRFLIPLENRVDFLTLQSGLKFEVPFAAMVVFATNLVPSQLVDEAFLRRIHYKVFADSPTEAEFAQIFERACREAGVAMREDVLDYLLHDYFPRHSIRLRGCQPRDLIIHAIAISRYRGQPPVLSQELMEAACASYFVEDHLQA